MNHLGENAFFDRGSSVMRLSDTVCQGLSGVGNGGSSPTSCLWMPWRDSKQGMKEHIALPSFWDMATKNLWPLRAESWSDQRDVMAQFQDCTHTEVQQECNTRLTSVKDSDPMFNIHYWGGLLWVVSIPLWLHSSLGAAVFVICEADLLLEHW